MPGSLKANYIFNLLNTVLGLLFPLITFPYAARVVMADGIGQVNFSVPSFLTYRYLPVWGYPCMRFGKLQESGMIKKS